MTELTKTIEVKIPEKMMVKIERLNKAAKGVKFILVSRWVGYDVEGTGSFACA
jgi:hypothetical protein